MLTSNITHSGNLIDSIISNVDAPYIGLIGQPAIEVAHVIYDGFFFPVLLIDAK